MRPTCNCSAYKFPHRLLDGKCSGICLVEETWYKNYGHGECSDCLHLDGYSCQIVDGLEKFFRCPTAQEFLMYNEVPIPKKLKIKTWDS